MGPSKEYSLEAVLGACCFHVEDQQLQDINSAIWRRPALGGWEVRRNQATAEHLEGLRPESSAFQKVWDMLQG